MTINLQTDTRFVSIETLIGTDEDDTLTGVDGNFETLVHSR